MTYWSKIVESRESYHIPTGTFLCKAPEIVAILLDGAHGNRQLALRRINFYINRAGRRLHNSTEVKQARAILERDF